MNTDLKHKELTEKIIALFYKVYNTLGCGFLEKVYLNAMMIDFKKAGIEAVSQQPIKIIYESEIIGFDNSKKICVIRVLILKRVY